MLPALDETTTEAGIACQEHCYDELGNVGDLVEPDVGIAREGAASGG
ncbi:hypothetical protein [Aeromonas bivalvium]|uniref:Uncharacterized protein n=1 Tax=Aeromonas bivalvium TaxID=440079 RepID=A0ABW9GKB4_9GAMM|nr:hypothetical protein [Aeromonas bivalvium]